MSDFAVSLQTLPNSRAPGAYFDVGADITNNGTQGSEDVEYRRIESTGSFSSPQYSTVLSTPSLNSGQTVLVSGEVPGPPDTGSYEHGIFVDNDSSTQTLTSEITSASMSSPMDNEIDALMPTVPIFVSRGFGNVKQQIDELLENDPQKAEELSKDVLEEIIGNPGDNTPLIVSQQSFGETDEPIVLYNEDWNN